MPHVSAEGSAAGRPATNSATRSARFRARQAEAGFVTVTVLVPIHAADDFRVAADQMRQRPHLTLGTLVDRLSGKLVSLHRWRKS